MLCGVTIAFVVVVIDVMFSWWCAGVAEVIGREVKEVLPMMLQEGPAMALESGAACEKTCLVKIKEYHTIVSLG